MLHVVKDENDIGTERLYDLQCYMFSPKISALKAAFLDVHMKSLVRGVDATSAKENM